jgi:AcrR family transcriptional regulator
MTAESRTEDAGTSLRADARRNRDQIIAAARQVFLAEGPDIPMEKIARLAGVGVGTLYRRFPDREALVRAVAIDNFERLLAGARAIEREELNAWEALGRFLRLTTDMRLTMRLSLTSARASLAIRDAPQTRELRQALLDILERLVRAAQDEGSLRRDVGTGDLIALLAMMIWPTAAVPDTTMGLVSQRCLEVILDGLSARPGTPLPGHPLTVTEVVPWVISAPADDPADDNHSSHERT